VHIPEQIKDYFRYGAILARHRVCRLSEYLRVFTPHSPVRILDMLPAIPTTIVDVGAHKGEWTAAYLRILKKKAEFFLIEPVQDLCDRLEVCFAKHDNVSLFRLALSSRRGVSELNVADRPDFSSLEDLDETVLDGLVNLRSREVVPTDTLDGFIKDSVPGQAIDLLKLDVQGHELAVLNNGKTALKRITALLVEWNIVNLYRKGSNFTDVHDFLTSQDFRLAAIPFQYREKNALLYADALYLRNSSPDDFIAR
jgi:FkbM family methyltransferase